MTSFEDRERAFETKFAHDAEMLFRAEARRTNRLALWVAAKMKLDAEERVTYAREMIAVALTRPGIDRLIDRFLADLSHAGVSATREEIAEKAADYLAQSKRELADGDD